MQWEQLTSPEFAEAVHRTGVCVVAAGVLERHSDHLPLGTDYLNGHRIACLAAEKEPAVVFPPMYWGQIYEARCFPGAFTLRPDLLVQLLLGTFDEIARNGFAKILVYNAHGGNWNMLRFLAQCTLWEEKPYTLYIANRQLTDERQKQWDALLETDEHAHACECETSVSLANHPELVKMGAIPKKPGAATRRAAHLSSLFTGVSWYSDYPQHYAGDARTASAEKGLALRQMVVDTLAEFIAAVKADAIMPTLNREFYDRERNLRQG